MSLKYFGVVLLLQFLGLSQALFEGCDHTYNLNGNSVAYLKSPLYPQEYPAGTSCRYKFIAPLDYEILAECSIDLVKDTSACSTEFFYIARDGDSNLAGADENCGIGNITSTTLFRSLVIAYISESPTTAIETGSFICKLTIRPQACDCGWSQSTRIVGGVEATRGEFPSMVALYHEPSNTTFCGGTIISHRGVLTATHCIRQFSNLTSTDLKILVGYHNLNSTDGSPYAAVYNVTAYIESPGYNESINANDISLLITATNIEWSRGVGPACLPLDQLNNTFDYQSVYVVGWGTTSFAGPKSDTLQKASVNLLPNSVCESVYPSLLASQVCTYYPDRDACQFDSGGPVMCKLTVREFLLGVISYGYACGTNPGVNTRMTSFIRWVQSYLGSSLCAKPFN